jgi:hypothetical protein
MITDVNQSIPSAYELKRLVALNRPPFWQADFLKGLPAAPIYVFPDQEAFDGDDVGNLTRKMVTGQLRLPHSEVIFEIIDEQHGHRSSVIYVTERENVIHAFLFARTILHKRWTDALCHARYQPDGSGTCEVNPNAKVLNGEDIFKVVHGMILRATALIMAEACSNETQLSRLRRSLLAKHGVSGWSYRVATIDVSNIRSFIEPAGGTHASPRWHVRRGHWRTLSNGQRVFVRECEVGDQARGGVVKDYRIDLGSAA